MTTAQARRRAARSLSASVLVGCVGLALESTMTARVRRRAWADVLAQFSNRRRNVPALSRPRGEPLKPRRPPA
eukprot:4168343-Alexandrium_andersonii.AAC.1